MSRCGQELCRNWAGSGCICDVLDIEPDIVCGHCGGFGCDECAEAPSCPPARRTPREDIPVSTYVYLECLDHTPPLRADDESGQHLSDLPQIRADLADRARVAADYDASAGWLYGDDTAAAYFRRNSARFLAAHPTCRIGIRDENGREYPVEAPENERTEP